MLRAARRVRRREVLRDGSGGSRCGRLHRVIRCVPAVSEVDERNDRAEDDECARGTRDDYPSVGFLLRTPQQMIRIRCRSHGAQTSYGESV